MSAGSQRDRSAVPGPEEAPADANLLCPSPAPEGMARHRRDEVVAPQVGIGGRDRLVHVGRSVRPGDDLRKLTRSRTTDPRRAWRSPPPREPPQRPPRAPTAGESRALDLAQQRPLLREPATDDRPPRLEQLEHDRIVDAVVDARALAPRLDQPDPAQRREMLRRAPRVQLELRLQRPDRLLPVMKQLENPHSRRVPQHPEHGRLRLVDRTRAVGIVTVRTQTSPPVQGPAFRHSTFG